MKKLVVPLVGAISFIVLTAAPALATVAAGDSHSLVLTVPGVDGCDFRFNLWSRVAPSLRTADVTTVVETGSLKITGTGPNCFTPIVPTIVEIYDRSPGMTTYHVEAQYGARQDVRYVGTSAAQVTAQTEEAGPTLDVPKRTSGLVTFEFRAPTLAGFCLMDVWSVVGPGVATLVSGAVPCPQVEP
jgi:hypothetical protein